MKTLMAVAIVAAATIGPAWADCSQPTSDEERARCIGEDLRRSDAEINRIYGELRDRLADPERLALRDEQRRWLHARDESCDLHSKESDREKWFAALLTDYGKTVCVVRFTDRRVAELQAELARMQKPPEATAAAPASPNSIPPQPAEASASAPKPPPEPPKPSAPQTPAATNAGDVYDLASHNARITGRWYFEVKLSPGEMAKRAETALFIGVHLPNSNIGTLQNIRKGTIGRDPVTIGIAYDLDDGKLYHRVNGTWLEQPGSAKGADLKTGRAARAWISSSTSLTDDMKDGLVDINLGQKPFAYALPDGYVAADPLGPISGPVVTYFLGAPRP